MKNVSRDFNYALSVLNKGDLKQAEKFLRRVVRVDQSHVPAHNLLTVVLMSMERFAEAEPFIVRAIMLNQSSYVSFYNYGLIAKRLNKPEKALEQFSNALNLNPNVSETWNNRGTVFNDLKKYDLAISDFDRAIALNRNYAEAYVNKGKSLTLLKRYDEAVTAFDNALSVKTDLAGAWLGHGNILNEFRRYEEAFAAYDKALSIKPDLVGAWLGRAHARLHRGQLFDGQKDLEHAVSLGADADYVAFELAKFGIRKDIDIMPKKIVKLLFDEYADRFDNHLTEKLKYDAPKSLFTLLRQCTELFCLTALDLGCGTGLMGTQIRPIANMLIGVDISEKMLEKARERAVYDSLICDEIVHFLMDTQATFDLIVATDVLVYIGNIRDLFKFVTSALVEGGLFAFTVEAGDCDEFILRPTGHYQHSKGYIDRLAKMFGLEVIATQEKVIRQDKGMPVPGYMYVLRKQLDRPSLARIPRMTD
jgi:predicted TPR repeat methyltransferase